MPKNLPVSERKSSAELTPWGVRNTASARTATSNDTMGSLHTWSLLIRSERGGGRLGSLGLLFRPTANGSALPLGTVPLMPSTKATGVTVSGLTPEETPTAAGAETAAVVLALAG